MMGGGRLLEAAQPDEWIDAQEVEATQLGGEYAALFEFGYRSFPLFELQELDESWVFSLFDQLEELSEGVFSVMKAELDETLRQKYRIR